MRLTIALLLLAFTSVAYASKEGILAFSSFRLESTGIGSSGKVVIEGQQDERGHIVSLKVEAFGKTFEVPKEKLGGLAELPSNGVRISYEHGYAELGGRTIYVELQMGFTSGTRKQALVTIAESGAIEVSPIEHKNA
jgi:hypothetical protein